MRWVGLSFLSIILLPLLLIFFILTSLKFQVLNYNYLVESFVRYNIYAKVPSVLDTIIAERQDKLDLEELLSYKKIAKEATPSITQDIVERNLKGIFNYLDGNTNEIVLYLPLKKLGIITNRKAEEFPVSTFIGPAFRDEFKMLNGITKTLTLVWVAVLLVIVGIFALEYKLSRKFLGVQLVVLGVLLAILTVLVRLFLGSVSTELNRGTEPSQRLLGLFADSIIPEVVNVYIVLAVTLLVAGILGTVIFNLSPKKAH